MTKSLEYTARSIIVPSEILSLKKDFLITIVNILIWLFINVLSQTIIKVSKRHKADSHAKPFLKNPFQKYRSLASHE